jgi:hypothetical protein
MNDTQRNMRTFIVCFVIAFMSLMALRLVEEGQKISTAAGSQVLGQKDEKEEKVILPNAEVKLFEVNFIGE